MAPLNLLLVAGYKEISDLEELMDAAKRAVPLVYVSAHKAVDAVGKLHRLAQTKGKVHAAIMHHKFTAKGKEEFSETLKEVLKSQYPDVPVICWGHSKKGGEHGKDWHHAIEEDASAADVVATLRELAAGGIVANYHHKGEGEGAGYKKRSSFMLLARKSQDGGAAAAAGGGGTGTQGRQTRTSIDGGPRPSLDGRPRPSMQQQHAPQQHPPSHQGSRGSNSFDHMQQGMGAMNLGSASRGNSLDLRPKMAGMMAAGNGMMAGGMGMPNGMGGGMMGGGMMGMPNGMGAMGGGMGMSGTMNAAFMPVNPMPMGGMAGGMGGMAMPPPPAPPADVFSSGLYASTGPATAAPPAAAGGDNTETIRMLAGEVVRLRALVEQKRASIDGRKPPQQA